MNRSPLGALVLAWSIPAFAGSFTVIDPFGQASCPSGVVTGCDAVGSTQQADFYRADFNFSATSGTINLYFNYGATGVTTLSPYAATANTTVSIADLFLFNGVSTYAIPLFNRTTANWGSATAGTVYRALSTAALLSSEVVLGNSADIDFRTGHPVWIDTNLSSLANVGSINTATNQVIDGNSVRFSVTLNLSYTSGSEFANFLNDPNLTMFTATTTAAQDLVPDAAAIPEPGTWSLIASAAGIMWVFRKRVMKPPASH